MIATNRMIDPKTQVSAAGRRLPRSRTARGGAAVVEFAIVASIFFTLILAMVEFSRVLMVSELINEAARRACRVAILENTTSTQIKKAATDLLTSVGINGETVNISVNDAPIDTVDPQPMPAYTEMTVIVSVPVNSVSWVAKSVWTGGQTLTGRFTMRRE